MTPRAGLEARLGEGRDHRQRSARYIFDRLEFEIDVINQMGFPGYFLIVADFIKWAKAKAFRWARGAVRVRAAWSPGR